MKHYHKYIRYSCVSQLNFYTFFNQVYIKFEHNTWYYYIVQKNINLYLYNNIGALFNDENTKWFSVMKKKSRESLLDSNNNNSCYSLDLHSPVVKRLFIRGT